MSNSSKPSPIVSNYVQHIFVGRKRTILQGASPPLVTGVERIIVSEFAERSLAAFNRYRHRRHYLQRNSNNLERRFHHHIHNYECQEIFRMRLF